MKALLGLVAFAVVAGCENPPPDVLEAAVVSDTSIESGPYEARVIAHDDDGIGASTLSWSVAGPLTVPRAGTVPLAVVVDETLQKGTRLKGLIPGQPLGSVVQWTLTVCDTGDRCAQNPLGDPYAFRVGPVPSAPAIARIDPDTGPASGGTRVEIHGDDLRPGAVVLFGAVEATSVEWLREDLVAAVTSPEDPGVVDVRLTNPDGRVALLESAFTFVPSPIVDSVEPASGPEAGGTAVIIRGGNFVDGVRGSFDGVPCRHQRLVDDTELDCDTPPGHHGLVDVVVRDEVGATGQGVLPDGYEYIQAPLVTAVDPGQGSSEGGTVVTVDGDGFRDGAVVTIGGAPCTDVVVLDAATLTCATPAGTPGAADVTVENDDGQQDTLPGGYGFLGPPIVVEVVPSLVPVAGGVEVRVLGSGLSDADDVSFGGAAGEVISQTGSAELLVRVPPVPAGLDPAPSSGLLAVDVTVTRTEPGDTRSGTLPAGLVYFWPPEVTAVAPPSGPTAGGTRVVVEGRFFRQIEGEDFTVLFADGACTDVEVTSTSSLQCTTPPGDPGFADVTVQNHPLSSGTAADAYLYIAPPRVDSADPPEGPTFGGEEVTVNGDFFQEGALVFIDGAPCSGADVVSAQEITCTTPPGAEGPADVRVVNPDAQEDTAEGIYRYLGVAVTPDHGLPVGFTRVRVRSAGMQADAVITFGGVAADCTFVSSREFVCQTPASALAGNGHGDVDVRFVNPDGTSETGTAAFHYRTYAAHSSDFPMNGENCNDVDLADFDGDGDLDAVVATGNVIQDRFGNTQEIPQDTSVWENDGHGVFTRRDINVFTVANNTSVADADGDGRPDVLIGATNGSGPILMENRGGFVFERVDLGTGSADDAFDAEFLDVVGDGRPDIYNLSAGCDPNEFGGGGCDPSVIGPDVLLEQVDNGFDDRSDLVPHRTAWVHDHKVIAADLDGDGDGDIVIVTNNTTFPSEQNRVLRNRVNEGLGFVPEFPAGLLNIFGDLYDLDAGDVDGDGDPDIVTTVCDGDFGEVLLRNEGGDLVRDTAALPSLTQSCTVGSALVDLDDDGDLDLLFGGTRDLFDTHAQLRVFINRGDGTYVDGSGALPSFGNEHLQLNNFAAGDIDRDRDVDILIAGGAPYFETDRPGRVVVYHLE